MLESLRDEVDESCSLAVLDTADILYLARASRNRIMSIGLHVGSRLPAWCTSMGRVLLAPIPAAERESFLPADPLPRQTAYTVENRAKLDPLFDAVLHDGYSLVDQELEIGLRSIAVPVKDNAGCTIAALNVGTNALERTSEDLIEKILPPLRRTASMLGNQVAQSRRGLI